MSSDGAIRFASPAVMLLVALGSLCTLAGQLLMISANGPRWLSVVLAVAAGTIAVLALILWWRTRRRARADRSS